MSESSAPLGNTAEFRRAINATAGTIRKLLPKCKDTRSPLFGLLQYALGAIVAFDRFVGFKKRLSMQKPSWKRTYAIATKLKQREELVGSENDGWMAGFYFNNAILRIAAVCERALRVLNDVYDPNAIYRIDQLKAGICPHVVVPGPLPSWDAVRQLCDEVNRLKHKQGDTRRGLNEGQAREALIAMGEFCRLAVNKRSVKRKNAKLSEPYPS